MKAEEEGKFIGEKYAEGSSLVKKIQLWVLVAGCTLLATFIIAGLAGGHRGGGNGNGGQMGGISNGVYILHWEAVPGAYTGSAGKKTENIPLELLVFTDKRFEARGVKFWDGTQSFLFGEVADDTTWGSWYDLKHGRRGLSGKFVFNRTANGASGWLTNDRDEKVASANITRR